MKLNLFWKDTEQNIYKLGTLYKLDNIFNFDIYENNLKQAIKHGCFGIGNFDFLKNHYESTELFDFFQDRIPKKNTPYIENWLSQFNLTEYDELEILKVTKGILPFDRYFLEEEK